MIIDTDQINELLKSDVPPFTISTAMDINNTIIDNLMNNRSKLIETKLKTLIKLQNYYNKNGVIKMEMPKIKGLKKAVGEFNKWQGAARIYYDKNENQVITYIYGGTGEWEDFHDTNIVEVMQKATSSILERDDKTTMAELAKACQNA